MLYNNLSFYMKLKVFILKIFLKKKNYFIYKITIKQNFYIISNREFEFVRGN